jgi:DNA-binding IclR family transcriptional regulator
MMRRSAAVLDSPSAKVLAVLDAVASRGTASMATIANDLAIPPPTIHRIAIELERLGYLQREFGSRQLTVSGPLVALASNVLFAASTSVAAQAILRRLSESIGEMCSLGVHVDDEVVYIASVEPQQELMLSFRAGRKAPLYCTSSGRLFLARLSDEELAAYLRVSNRKAFTSYTRTDAEQIKADVRKVRTQGYAISNQEYIRHISGAAVPVMTQENKLVAALSVAALSVRASPQRLRQFIPKLQQAADALASCLAQTDKPRGARHRIKRSPAIGLPARRPLKPKQRARLRS